MQAHISKGVEFFKDKFAAKFGLTEYSNDKEPLVIFGMYTRKDLDTYLNHKGIVTVVWCGSDAIKVVNIRSSIKSRQARHIATSSFIAKDLDRYRIPYEFIPVSAASIDLQPCNRGDNIYFYGDDKPERDFYGQSYLPEIEKRTGLNIIKTTKNTYSHKELIEVYNSCFIGLRLTKHDGVPTTVTELGLMGRRCIHNGATPHSIPYNNIDDICEGVMREYNNRHRDDIYMISNDWKEYINIGTGRHTLLIHN